MYVCSCRGTTDRDVDRAIAGGAATVEEIGVACGAGQVCGGCWPTLERLLDEFEASTRRHRPVPATT